MRNTAHACRMYYLWKSKCKDAYTRGRNANDFPPRIVTISASLLTTTLTYFLFKTSRYATTEGMRRYNAPVVDRSSTEVSPRGPSFPRKNGELQLRLRGGRSGTRRIFSVWYRIGIINRREKFISPVVNLRFYEIQRKEINKKKEISIDNSRLYSSIKENFLRKYKKKGKRHKIREIIFKKEHCEPTVFWSYNIFYISI